MMKLKDKRIWITGAGSGIGAAMAGRLSGIASLLVISALEEDDLQDLKRRIAHENTRIEVLPFDLGNPDQVTAAAKQVINQFGGVDVLINNGGISQRGLVADTTMEVDRRIMEINFFGHIRLTKLLLPAMLEQKSGHIAVTSSMVGKFGFPLRSSYAASKHALQGYFETLGLEYFDKGIRTTVVLPGRIQTNISVNAISGTGEKHGLMDPGQAGGMPAQICARKYLRAIEKEQWEVYIGNSEILMIWFRRYLPKLFRFLARRVGVK
jgi:dehydrogenase/reductase SDR family member 7B